MEKAICQYILANIINILVILTHKQHICQCYGEMSHSIGKYFCDGVFHEVTADVVTNGYLASIKKWPDKFISQKGLPCDISMFAS